MGRRALRKIDPALDLSRHLKTWEELPRPWETAPLFGREAPLEVEVGSGKGLFLQSAAAALLDHNFLGTEIATKYARFAAARLAKDKLTNGVVVQCDAQRLFAELLPDASLAAVHIYFPDPWWKKRHHKRRVINEPFVRDVERALASGGTLHFWTDVLDYFALTKSLISANTKLVGPLPVAERRATHTLDYQTHFERRMRLSRLPVHRTRFQKN